MEKFKSLEKLESTYLVINRKITEFQLDLTGFVFDDFEVVKPIKYFSFKTETGNAGWILYNRKNDEYEIQPNVFVMKKYNDLNAKYEYFGIRYCDTDGPFYMSRDLIIKHLLAQKESYYFKSEFNDRLKLNLEMFDNNIKFFDSLDSIEFEKALQHTVEKYHFKQIKSVSGFRNCLYILVFDKYKQFYVGSAKSLSNRTKKHWNAIMDFGRFTWVGVKYSRLNVDTFRMKDNTRIFVLTDIEQLLVENKEKNVESLENTNTFGIYKFESMTDLEKAERIVINDSMVKFCLSDRVPINCDKLTIQDYLNTK